MRTAARAVMALYVALGGAGVSIADPPAESPLEVATKYYEGIAGRRDVASVPMAEDLKFRGPGRTASSAGEFREALRGLSAQVRSLELRRQLADGEVVMTFYDLDLGAPEGPIPMAEKLRVADGEIVEVELLFDSRRLPSARPDMD